MGYNMILSLCPQRFSDGSYRIGPGMSFHPMRLSHPRRGQSYNCSLKKLSARVDFPSFNSRYPIWREFAPFSSCFW